jgi:hypothetical protein
MDGISYTIVRSARRKTIGVSVAPDNRVTVRAPFALGERRIAEIVAEKSAWIRKRMALNRERASGVKPREYADGEEFLFLGKSYPLERVEGWRGVTLLDGRLCVGVSRADGDGCGRIAARIGRWYRSNALGILNDRVNAYRERLGVSPKAVRIKTHRSRWGSCSSRGNLNFNWLLVLAPLEIIDYVVVHELCHFMHPDHSPRFWNMVESVLPDYRERRKWLKTCGGRLAIEQCGARAEEGGDERKR